MSTAKGWAVIKSNGLIHVRTVSDTRRAAIINWLITEKQVEVYAYHTDADIEALWKHYGNYADCKEVSITPAKKKARKDAWAAELAKGNIPASVGGSGDGH